MADSILNIETYWEDKPATGDPCEVCGEKIYSAAHELMMKVGERVTPTGVEVCNSCYYLIKDNV